MTEEEILKLLEEGDQGKPLAPPPTYSPNQGEGGTGAERFRRGLAKGVQSLVPFGNWRERTEEARSAGYEPSGITKGTTGAMQGVFMGAIPTMNAVGEEIGARIAGTDDKTFSERREEIGNLMDEESGLIGEIGGALIGGPRAAYKLAEEGAEQIPALARLLKSRGKAGLATRTGFTGTLGGAETFAYSWLSGADFGEAGYDAMVGGLGGVAAQPVSELITALAKKVGPAFGRGNERKAAEDIVQVIKNKAGDEFVETAFGQEQLNVEAIEAMMKNGDENLVTLFPEALVKTVRSMSTDPRQEVNAAANDLITYMVNLQKSALPQFRGAVGDALGSAEVRTAQDLINQGQATREALQPRYDSAFAAATKAGGGRAAGVKVRDLRQAIEKQFKGAKLPAQQKIKERLLAQLPDEYKMYGRNKRLQELTPRQLLQLRQVMDDVIYNQQFPSAGDFDAASVDKTMLRNFVLPTRAVIKDRLYQVAPGIKQIDEEYSDEISLRHAYEAGVDAFKDNTGGNTAKYDSFMGKIDRTPKELSTFVEGVKAELIKNINRKSSPAAVENYVKNNTEKFDLVEMVAGKDVRAALEQQVERYALVNQATKGVDPNAPSIYTGRDATLPQLGDAALMAGSAAGVLSSAIGAGAGRRQLSGLGAQGVGASAQAGALSNALLPPADVGSRAINEELFRNLPTLFRGLPAFAPAGSAGNDD